MPRLISPWDDEDQWLPRFDPTDETQWARMSAPMTPPFLPPSMPPPPTPRAAIGPLKAPSSLEALRELEQRRPMYGDPAYQPSKKRAVLGNLAGIAAGAAAGYLNAGGKVRVDPTVGAKLGDTIKNVKFNRASREFEQQREGLANQAAVDAKIEDDRRRASESQARIESEQAQKEAAQAARDRANRPLAAPRPIERDPTKDLVNPITGEIVIKGERKQEPVAQSWQQRIFQIRGMDATDEEKERLIKQLEDDYKRVNPEKGAVKFVEDANGNITAVTTTASEVSAAGGQKKFGRLGKGRDASPSQAEQSAQVRKTDEADAMRILSENAGDHDKAIAAAKSMGVRKALQEDKRRGKLGADPGNAQQDRMERLKSALGITSPTPTKDGSKQPVTAIAAPEIPPAAAAQLKEGQVTTFKNGQKWTLENGKPKKL